LEKEFAIRAGQSVDGLEVGFPAYGLLIDNLTNQWYYETSRRRYIPPYQSGVTVPLTGTSVARILCQAPGALAQAAPVTSEYAIASYVDQVMPGGLGIALGPLGSGPPARPVFYGQQFPSGQALAVSAIAFNASSVGPAGATIHATLVVPAGAVAYVEFVRAMVYRDGAPSVAGIVQAYVRYTLVGGGAFIVCQAQIPTSEATLQIVHEDQLGPFGWLTTGDKLEILTGDGSTGGTCAYDVVSKYLLFAAP
jgi:hypothetical protein